MKITTVEGLEFKPSSTGGITHMLKGRFLPFSDSSFPSHRSMMAFTRQY
ncbi:hypothetical protein KKJ04_22050 [Xenorhabdus bovienii]|nr:hypothetical protein [Xenorhabdus bovienii]MDE9448116.1 hypothetical protein [Xenorhabdus bovienii]